MADNKIISTEDLGGYHVPADKIREHAKEIPPQNSGEQAIIQRLERIEEKLIWMEGFLKGLRGALKDHFELGVNL